MVLFIIYVFLSSAGLVLFKLGSSSLNIQLQQTIFSMNISLISLLGLFCYLISFILWMLIISFLHCSFRRCLYKHRYFNCFKSYSKRDNYNECPYWCCGYYCRHCDYES